MHVKPWYGSSRRIELNHTLRCLCGSPSIPLSFNLAVVLPRRTTYRVSYDTEGVDPPTSSGHRLGPGLPGYLIPFAPLAFAFERQKRARILPSPWCSSRSLRISLLHLEFHIPLSLSSPPVFKGLHRLSR